MKPLRRWQRECIDIALKHYSDSRHFMCLATPGAGKSIMAAELCRKLHTSGKIDFVLCFSPSLTVADGLQETFSDRFELRFDGLLGAVGSSYTYQAMKYIQDVISELLQAYRVMAVFDEIHHCAGETLENSNSCGEHIIKYIQNKAEYTLALSGTPWRSDKLPVSLARYARPDNRIICDYIYGLSDAINDSVCRVPKIVLVDNDEIEVKVEGDEIEVFNGLEDLFTRSKVSYQSILSKDNAIAHLLLHASIKLDEIRKENPNAAGLVVASSIQHANQIVQLLRKKLSRSAIMVSHHQKNSTYIINDFRNSDAEWIVSVGMISEGTDIPRLQVCCHLSRIRTELYFRQVLGRILRVTDGPNKFAWLYSFAEPSITKYAENLNEEIPEYDVLEKESALYGEYDDHEYPCAEDQLGIDKKDVIEENSADNIDLGDGYIINDENCSEIRMSEYYKQRVIDLFLTKNELFP